MLMMPANRTGWHPLGKRIGLPRCLREQILFPRRRSPRLPRDPKDEPFVDINMLSDGRDLRRLVDAFKLIYRIMEVARAQTRHPALVPRRLQR